MNAAFWVVTAGSVILAAIGYARQNRPGKIGGPIALSKGIWLHYTLYTWFLFVPYAYFTFEGIPAGDRAVWTALALSMWIRGIAEAVMLFVTKNWTPIIGISHDVLTFGIMILAYFSGERATIGTDPVLACFTLSLILSIAVETHHAASFYTIMRGKTQGDEGLWYAHKGDPRFLRILRVTAFFNAVLYAALAAFMLRAY